jgi:hypothetical protein
VSANGTLAEDKMRRFKSECAHFNFNKRPVYTHDGASYKFSTNSQETDNNAWDIKTSQTSSAVSSVKFIWIKIFRIGEQVVISAHVGSSGVCVGRSGVC